jgi:hypothetical protein
MGHAAIAPTLTINLPCLVGLPLRSGTITYHIVDAGSCVVRHSKIGCPTSESGQKQTFRRVRVMSAIHPKADIAERN